MERFGKIILPGIPTCRKRYVPFGPQKVREVFSQKLQSKLMPKKAKARQRVTMKSSSLDYANHLDSNNSVVDGGLEEQDTEYMPYREELLGSYS